MPVYIYEARDESASCSRCRGGFDVVQRLAESALTVCPHCGNPVRKRLTAVAIGRSRSSLDSRAKAAGFTKLKRLGRGEYEKQY